MHKSFQLGRWMIVVDAGAFAAFSLMVEVHKIYQVVKLALGPVSIAAVRT